MDHKIKHAIYSLQVLKGGGEHTFDLQDGIVKQVDLIAGIPFSCKAILIDKKPPLLFNI